jgi:hypothetical protein
VESIVIILIRLRHAFFDKTIWWGATRWLFLGVRRAAWLKKHFKVARYEDDARAQRDAR